MDGQRAPDRADAISDIWQLVDEFGKPGWDGNGAEPISRDAAARAAAFIAALPNDVAPPEIAPDPDGAISLDWIRSRERLFSLSVGASGRLAYAWLDGMDRGHGVAAFDGANVSWRILEEIRGVTGHADTAVRTA